LDGRLWFNTGLSRGEAFIKDIDLKKRAEWRVHILGLEDRYRRNEVRGQRAALL
jgi:hypothetical protein